MKYAHLTLTICFCFLSGIFLAQDVIYLENPSFEDMSRHSVPPRGWYDCGDPNHSPPDTQPGWFNVDAAPSDGDSYLGLTVRDDETWESVAQKLSRPLEAKKCYYFNLDLCRSQYYRSASNTKGQYKDYITPAVLKIWGGRDYCSKTELLGITDEINHFDWFRYDFYFNPSADYDHILLEIFYKIPVLFPYNGNILIDNASAIKPINCDSTIIEKANQPAEDIIKTAKYQSVGVVSGPGNIVPSNRNELVNTLPHIYDIIEEDWEFMKFDYGVANLSKSSLKKMTDFATILKENSTHRAYIALADGEGDLAVRRLETLTNLFEEIGVPKTLYRINPLMKSDFNREWQGKSIHLWVRTERGYFERRKKRRRQDLEKESGPKPPPLKKVNNLIEFEKMIKKNTKKIEFILEEDELSDKGFWALEEIVENLKSFSKYKLLIVMDREMEINRNAGAETLRRELKDMGLEQRQFRVRYLEKEDLNENWTGKNLYVRMRLEKRG